MYENIVTGPLCRGCGRTVFSELQVCFIALSTYDAFKDRMKGRISREGWLTILLAGLFIAIVNLRTTVVETTANSAEAGKSWRAEVDSTSGTARWTLSNRPSPEYVSHQKTNVYPVYIPLSWHIEDRRKRGTNHWLLLHTLPDKTNHCYSERTNRSGQTVDDSSESWSFLRTVHHSTTLQAS